MLGLLTRNFGWKLLSLVAAIGIWLSVASEPELATVSKIPVEYKGIPDELEISSEVQESVTIETRGSAGRLRDLPSARSAVVLDFSSVHAPGSRTFDIDARNVILPRGITLVRVIPAQLPFTFERRQMRDIPVEVRLAPPHKGYVVVSSVASPAKLRIVGPESAVLRPQSVATDVVDIGGVVSSAQYRVNTYLPEPLVHFQGPSHVTVHVVVKKK